MLRQGRLAFALSVLLGFLFLAGCASNNKKNELRDKVVAQSGFVCEFVNGEQNRQVEMELNVMMAKRCDLDKPFSVTNYKTSAEVTGVIYCCKTKDQTPAAVKPVTPAPSVPATPTSTTTSVPAKPAAPGSDKKPTFSSPSLDKKPEVKETKKPTPPPASKTNDLDIEIEP